MSLKWQLLFLYPTLYPTYFLVFIQILSNRLGTSINDNDIVCPFGPPPKGSVDEDDLLEAITRYTY